MTRFSTSNFGRNGRQTHGGAYWDQVIGGWESTPAQRLWRAHSDAVNNRLLRGWLAGVCGRLLKTDLFDEAVGCGLYPELTVCSAGVVGVDVSEVVVGAASERYPELDAHVADVLALPFDDAGFDVVVSNSTLDHFDSYEKLRAAVDELARCLRPGGKLLITLDNRANPIVALRTSVMFEPLHRLGVVPYFVGVTHGARGLSKLLRGAGFEVRETAALMHCPPQLAAKAAARLGARRHAAPDAKQRYLRSVLRFEAMGGWPTRHLTAHFVAALAIRR